MGQDTQTDGSVQGVSHGHVSHKEDTNPTGRGRSLPTGGVSQQSYVLGFSQRKKSVRDFWAVGREM